MCNLYRMTSNVEAISRLFSVTDSSVNLPEFPAIYPDREAPVVRQVGGVRRLDVMHWGFPPPPGVARPVTNVRNLASSFWRSALANPERRCLVPVTAFCEWSSAPDPETRRKRQYWFTMADPVELPFAFAGIWRPAPDAGTPARMAFLTCAPNALVGAVHPKAMPVIVPRAHYADWLDAPYDTVVERAQPFDDSQMAMLDA